LQSSIIKLATQAQPFIEQCFLLLGWVDAVLESFSHCLNSTIKIIHLQALTIVFTVVYLA
jgi:hypothetical protein